MRCATSRDNRPAARVAHRPAAERARYGCELQSENRRRPQHTLQADVESFGCRVLGDPEHFPGGRIERRRARLCTFTFMVGVHPHYATGEDTNMTTPKGLVVPAGGGQHLDMTTPGRFAALRDDPLFGPSGSPPWCCSSSECDW